MPELQSTTSDLQAVVEAGRLTVPPTVLEPGRAYAFATPSGIEVVDRTDERYLDRPSRKSGTVEVLDAQAFIAYLAKHAVPSTEVWSDEGEQTLVAVINAHAEDHDDVGSGAEWQDHRVRLVLRQTPGWKAWAALDGHLVDQQTFAEHIEANAPDVRQPTAATMLELAESFQATTSAEFESTNVLAGGKRALVFKETVSARAGQRGEIEIPGQIELALRPFYGSPVYKVLARFRYRLVGGHLQLGYKLERPHDVLESAYRDLVAEVGEGIEQPIWAGRAETKRSLR